MRQTTARSRAWLVEEYPALAADARRERAMIDWADEMGLRSDHVTGNEMSPGRPDACGARDRTTLRFPHTTAITNRGALAFTAFQGNIHNPRLHRVHEGRSAAAGQGQALFDRRWSSSTQGCHHQTLRGRQPASSSTIRSPGRPSRSSDPDHGLNQDVKTNALGKSRPTTEVETTATVRRHLHRRQKQPRVIRNLFREAHVRYAAS